jgi:hypothetical protein
MQNQSKCYLALQIMDSVPQCVGQHRHILKASLLRWVIVQIQTLPTVVDPYVDQPLQQLIPPNIWLFLTTNKTAVCYNHASPDGIIDREFLSLMSVPKHLSIPHHHILDPLIRRIPQAWSSGDNPMSIYELNTVAIDGTTTTMVGSVEGVLSGVRHVDEDELG